MAIYKVKGKKGESWGIDFYDDGRRIRKIIGSKQDAEHALTLLKADSLRGELKLKNRTKIRFEDFAKKYLEYAKVNKRSWKRDESSLKNLLPFFGYMLLSKITVGHIEEFKRMRLERVMSATVNRDLACLKHMFTIAEKLGKFDGKNPVKETKFLQERQFIAKVLNREEIQRLIDASNGYLRAMIILALNTGMRRGEIFNLRWSDVDSGGYIYIKKTKSSVMRKVPMNSIVRATLESIERENEYVFPSPKTGKPFKDIWYAFQRVCKKARIKDLRFYDLRHTGATYMITSAGVDLVTVKEILGHSSIQMTMRYAHPTPENKRRAVNALASAFAPEVRQKAVRNQSDEEIEEDITSLLSDNKN